MSKQDIAVQFGSKLAREVFRKRGNHTEAHLSEAELAALLGLAYELGTKNAKPSAIITGTDAKGGADGKA